MLKEQLLGMAIKALAQVHETKEFLAKNWDSEAMQGYVRGLKDAAKIMLDRLEQASGKEDGKPKKSKRAVPVKHGKTVTRAPRKSSIRPAAAIKSLQAEEIFRRFDATELAALKKRDAVFGTKSLNYVLWALGYADVTNLSGMSVHDVSALLHRVFSKSLYPINISRVVHGNPALIKMAGQHQGTKTYRLTNEGQKALKKLSL